MPYRQTRVFPALVLGALTLTQSCGSTAFIPTMGETAVSGGKTQDAGGTPAGSESVNEGSNGGLVPGPGGWVDTQTGTGTATGTDSETQAGVKPQPVSGVFLTCATLTVPSADAGTANYGCNIDQAQNTPANMFGAQVNWAVISDADGTSIGSAASFASLPPGSPWMVQLSMPAAMTAAKSVQATVTWPFDQQPQVLATELSAASPSNAYEIANSALPYHIGDGQFEDTSHCYNGVASVPLLGPGLDISFTVGASGANINLALAGLCGIDYDLLSTFSVLNAAGQSVASLQLRRGSHSASLAPVSLPAGTYTVQVQSGRYQNDLDDFVIAAIFLQSDQPLQVGNVTPMPSNAASISGSPAVNN